MSTKPMLVLYHSQCRDGWCAAWVAHQRFPDAELRPVMYGTPLPNDVEGRSVLLLDFCYKRHEMEYLCRVANVCVLDHHATALSALEGLEEQITSEGKHVEITFNMGQSGCELTWDALFEQKSAPWLVRYVGDRDLWRWALPNSREVNAFISTLPYGRPEHLVAWDEAAKLSLSDVISSGRIVLQANKRYAEAVCENWLYRNISDYVVPSVNAPQHEISEVLETLLNLYPDAPFVHGWWQRGDGVYANSLRSCGEFDVSAIAKMFGGGGHKNAAGYQTKEIKHPAYVGGKND